MQDEIQVWAAAAAQAGKEVAGERSAAFVGVVSILDRLAGGAAKIALASGDAPYEALATIDDVYPDRPDRS